MFLVIDPLALPHIYLRDKDDIFQEYNISTMSILQNVLEIIFVKYFVFHNMSKNVVFVP